MRKGFYVMPLQSIIARDAAIADCKGLYSHAVYDADYNLGQQQ